MKSFQKLRMFFSKKERDTMFEFPSGIYTKADAAYLNHFFTKEFMEELEKRGYDWQTVKFEISPKLPNADKFPCLTGEFLRDA